MWLRITKYIIKIQVLGKKKILQKNFPCGLQDCIFVGFFYKKGPENSKQSVTDPVLKILFCTELA